MYKISKREMVEVGEAAISNGLSWFGEERNEVIVISHGDYLLLEYESKKMTSLGNKMIEVKERLKDIGKDKNFTDFMDE